MASFLRRKSSGSPKKAQRRTSTGKVFLVDTTGGTRARPLSIISSTGEEVARWEDTVSKRLRDSLQPRERQRQRVIFEVVKTEQAYLRDLVLIRDLFRARLREAHCLPDETLYRLFSNLDDVIATNDELYRELVKLSHNGIVTGCISSVFIEMFGAQRFDP